MAGIRRSQAGWPETCKYFDPTTMDAEYTRDLLEIDTEYSDQEQSQQCPLECVNFSEDGLATYQKLTLGQVDSPVQDSSNVIRALFLFQKRRYYDNSSTSEVHVTPETWLHLLDQLMIPPIALEVLHDNSGGYGSLVSRCSNRGIQACPHQSEPLCAYHIWVKVGSCNNLEHFAYARHDFHTGRGLLLILGTGGGMFIRRLTSQFRGQGTINVFYILLALQSTLARQIEDYRWRLDYAVQDIESKTGHSSLTFPDVEPLSPEQLTLSRDIVRTSNALQSLIRGATSEGEVFAFLSSQLKRFTELNLLLPNQPAFAQSSLHDLCDSFAQYESQANAQVRQMQSLKLRIDAQWNVVNALIAQRDSRVNIDIAAATKADSELMRGIAVATLFFLPATFLATFFSMVFFTLDSTEGRGKLVVSKWIWLFPACTVPLTVLLALNYGIITGSSSNQRIGRK